MPLRDEVAGYNTEWFKVRWSLADMASGFPRDHPLSMTCSRIMILIIDGLGPACCWQLPPHMQVCHLHRLDENAAMVNRHGDCMIYHKCEWSYQVHCGNLCMKPVLGDGAVTIRASERIGPDHHSMRKARIIL